MVGAPQGIGARREHGRRYVTDNPVPLELWGRLYRIARSLIMYHIGYIFRPLLV